MAMANVAELFYRAGLKVLMVDWDLEAPGLERFFYSEPEDLLRGVVYEEIINDWTDLAPLPKLRIHGVLERIGS